MDNDTPHKRSDKIRVAVNSEELKQIKDNAYDSGFSSMSEYLRYIGVNATLGEVVEIPDMTQRY